jgi:hypothetical protein
MPRAVKLSGTRNKYKVRTDRIGKLERTYRGRLYASKLECHTAQTLDLLVRGGEVRSWAPQKRFPLVVKDVKVGVYIADFVVVKKDGSLAIWESKGKETPEFKIKWKLVEALYPQYELRLIR